MPEPSDLTERVITTLHDIAGGIGGRPRESQDHMAEAVVWAIEGKRPVAIEAPTGTGKSLAGTLPFLVAGMRTVVSTGTRHLQEQYRHNDLPVIVDHLAAQGMRRTFAVLKGRTNYGCRMIADTVLAGERQLFEDGQQLSSVQLKDAARWVMDARDGSEWVDATKDVPFEVRSQLSADADTCLGKRCSFFETCHAEVARKRAASANLVLVNHALLCANVAYGGKLIPVAADEPFGFFIDEAHLLETAAERTFGSQLVLRESGNGGEHGTIADIADGLCKLGIDRHYDETLPAELRAASSRLRCKLDDMLPPPGQGNELGISRDERAATLGSNMASLDALAERSLEVIGRFTDDGDCSDAEALVLRRATSRAEAVLGVTIGFADDDVSMVTFAERVKRSVRLSAVDVNCGKYLAPLAWKDPVGRDRPVVLASATIPAGYVARIGLPDCPEYALPSPFALQQRQVVYVADHLPSPSKARPQWSEQAPPLAYDIADVALRSGSVLVLCTSWAMVTDYAKALKGLPRVHPGCNLYVDSPDVVTSQLVDTFARDDHGILISAQGAWTGVDLPGKLRAVIIPAVPMPVPGQPLNEARKELWASRALPHPIDRSTAAAKLAQGIGRLIRCDRDWGVCAVLDPRVVNASYARDLQAKIPAGAVLVGDEYRQQVLSWLATGPDVAAAA